MLQHLDLELLRAMEPITYDGSQSRGFEQVLKNSLKRETKRTMPQMISDHAKGLGFEEILVSTDIFDEYVPPIVEDADELGDERFRDLFYNGAAVQVKCVSKLYGNLFYLTPAMFKSILKSAPLNDFFIFGTAEPMGDRDQGNTVFSYLPAFVMSSALIVKLASKGWGSGENGEDIKISLDRIDKKFPDEYQPIRSHLI